MRKALILGVGNPQVDAIHYLKKAGWRVIGCGDRREGRGLNDVDQFELVDVADPKGLEEVARREGVDLIYSVGSDLAMPSVAKVARALHLPSFVDPETAEVMHHKVLLRDALATQDLSPILYKKVRSASDGEGWTHFPAVIKPADSQGQRGVFRVDSSEELKKKLNQALHFSKQGTAILEEFLEGPEISVNAFVLESQTKFVVVSDRKIAVGRALGIPRCHLLPSASCRGQLWDETRLLVERCIQFLGIENGPVYFQIKLTSQGPRILEIAPRLDGCHLWRLIKMVHGVDLLDASFRYLMGDFSPSFDSHSQGRSCYLGFFLSPPDRSFAKSDHPPPRDTLFFEHYYRDGERVRPINGALEKVGYYIEKVN